MFRQIDKRYEENEHSLEMHTMYIKKVFKEKDIKVVPLMVGQIEKEELKKYGKVLVKYLNDERTLFIISSDFCHWGSRFSFTHKFSEFKDD